tara:strand:+ start:7898 stop:8281 length:384 start_codon:yes stop_codon:yes gene_type:complete
MNLNELSDSIATAVSEHGAAQVATVLCSSLTALSNVNGGVLHHEDSLGQVKVTPIQLSSIKAVPSKDSVDRLNIHHIGEFKLFLKKYIESCANIKGERLTETELDQISIPLISIEKEIASFLSALGR